MAEAAGSCPDNWPYLVTAYLLGVVVPAPDAVRRAFKKSKPEE